MLERWLAGAAVVGGLIFVTAMLLPSAPPDSAQPSAPPTATPSAPATLQPAVEAHVVSFAPMPEPRGVEHGNAGHKGHGHED